jgi:hypothetical protein
MFAGLGATISHMRRKTGESTAKAREFMQANPGLCCDNCLREVLELSRPHLNERDISGIAEELGLVRDFTICPRCKQRGVLSFQK